MMMKECWGSDGIPTEIGVLMGSYFTILVKHQIIQHFDCNKNVQKNEEGNSVP